MPENKDALVDEAFCYFAQVKGQAILLLNAQRSNKAYFPMRATNFSLPQRLLRHFSLHT